MYIQCKTGYILTVTQKYIYIWTGGDYMHVFGNKGNSVSKNAMSNTHNRILHIIT